MREKRERTTSYKYKNDIVIGEMSTGGRFIIDIEDISKVLPYSWYATKESKCISSTTCGPEGITLARLIMGVTDSNLCIRHKDDDKGNCRKENLEVININQMARCRDGNKKKLYTQYKGVSKRRGTWTAQIHIDKKKVHLGDFENEHEAATAYNKQALISFGKDAKLNVIGNPGEFMYYEDYINDMIKVQRTNRTKKGESR